MRRVRIFPPDRHSPVLARAHVAALLGGHGLRSERVALLVEALATNAVQHARTAFTVEVDIGHDVVRVAVVDADPVVPPALLPGGAGGRGVALLERHAAGSWGVEPVPDGKAVWFEVPAEPVRSA